MWTLKSLLDWKNTSIKTNIPRPRTLVHPGLLCLVIIVIDSSYSNRIHLTVADLDHPLVHATDGEASMNSGLGEQLGEDSSRMLARACERGDVATVAELLRQNSSLIDRCDEYYELPPLHIAASRGQSQVLRCLFKEAPYGVMSINARDGYGNTALMLASREGQEDVLSILLENGADAAMANDEGVTPLMTACCNGYVDIMRILLLSESSAGIRRGASVTTDAAERARRIWLAEAINADGETALWLACYWGCPQAVDLLLAAGGGLATVGVRDRVTGLTPRGVAMREGSELMRIEDAERAYILIRARCIHEASGKTKESSMRTASRSLESGCTDNGGDDCEVFARVVEWMIGSLSRDLVIELTDFLLGCLPCGCDAL